MSRPRKRGHLCGVLCYGAGGCLAAPPASARLLAYMRDSMAMPHAFDGVNTDQRQNQIARHMAQFCNRERRRIRRELLAVGVISEGVWVYRASVIAAIKKATRAGL